MKKVFLQTAFIMFSFSTVVLLTSCGGVDTENAENKDTVSTYIEPHPDNTTVRPDTMQTIIPQDSAKGKDSMK